MHLRDPAEAGRRAVTALRLVLVDPEIEMVVAWRRHFQGLANVETVAGYFEQLPVFDCMVSAANSFGLMDGGVDAAIIRFFGDRLMNRVQRRILDEYLGEQPVGTSMIVETDHPRHPFIAHTPTMRVPMDIAHTDNVYRAMWAMLLAVQRHNEHAERRIAIVACPGLGTATHAVILSAMFVLAVPDLERSGAFYRDVLGFEVRETGDPGCSLRLPRRGRRGILPAGAGLPRGARQADRRQAMFGFQHAGRELLPFRARLACRSVRPTRSRSRRRPPRRAGRADRDPARARTR